MKSVASLFRTAASALFFFASAALACVWLFVADEARLFVAIADEPRLLRSPAVMAGVMLLMAAATYGAVEVVRTLRRKARVYPPVGTLLVVLMLLSGGTLVTTGVRAARRSAATRILEDLRLIDPAIGTECATEANRTRWGGEPLLPEV